MISPTIRRIIFICITQLFIILNIFAQERTVTGKITDASDGTPLIGSTIVIQGTTTGTTSDLDGNYSLSIPEGSDTLIFSFVGYDAEKVAVGSQSIINVALSPEPASLDEVVVIGYGTVRKSDLSGAVGTLKSEDITKITSINPEQSLQGKVTGVHVTSSSGAPGASPVVRIRGVGTFNNSSPIYVVDGVILNDISFLNSADISSMEILKDASATAIYGSRGANGVILISTKAGSAADGKTRFEYSYEYGYQQVSKHIDLLNGEEFAIITNEIVPGTYNNIDLLPNTDWQDLIFRTAPMHNHQLSASGGSDKMQYYFSFGYYNQDGIIDKSSYRRYTLRLNNNYSLFENLQVGNNISIAPFRQQNAPNVVFDAYRAQPVLEPYLSDGSFSGVYNVGNPLASLAYSNDFNNGVRGVGSVFAEATILKMFKFKSSYGVDAEYIKVENFTPAYQIYYPDGTPAQQQNLYSDLYKESNDNFSWLWENTLSFKYETEKHNLDLVGGFTMQKISSERLKLHGENIIRDGEDFRYINPSYIVDETNNINTVLDISNTVDAQRYYAMISFLFRANYTYNDKYILTVTYRRDGSSKFSEDNRYADFPSFAAGWNIHKESFMQNIPLLSRLKIRGSWGIIGNEKIGYYDQYSRVESDLVSVFGDPDVSVPAATYGKSGNQDLRWENTKQTDIGLEIGLFKNKLTGEFDYYNRVTEDILVQLSTPGHLGNGIGQKITYNAAEVLNRGFEFMLNWQETRKDFTYNIGVLGTTVHNEVLTIGGNSGIDSVIVGGNLANGVPVTRSEVGLPIGAFYGYETDGIFQDEDDLAAYPHTSLAEPGDLRFVDQNGDGIINDQDRTYIGSPIPDFIFGFNAGIEYKGIDFSVALQGQTGNELFNGKEMVRPDPYNFEAHVFDRWTGPGTSNTEPRSSFGGYNFNASDRFIQDGSYLRIRNVILGYTLPAALSKKFFIDRLRIYVKGTNLYTWSKFTGYTPEIGTVNSLDDGGDVLSNGIDKGTYPIARVYSFGINLSF